MDQILIIDDDVALCELVTEYLEPLGFQIESIHRGDTGAERAVRLHSGSVEAANAVTGGLAVTIIIPTEQTADSKQ